MHLYVHTKKTTYTNIYTHKQYFCKTDGVKQKADIILNLKGIYDLSNLEEESERECVYMCERERVCVYV